MLGIEKYSSNNRYGGKELNNNRPFCTCKEDKEFCDICLQVALDEFVKQGKLKRVIVDGEYAYVNSEPMKNTLSNKGDVQK